MDEFIRSKVIQVGDFSAEVFVEKDWSTKESLYDIFVKYQGKELSSSAFFLDEEKIKDQLKTIIEELCCSFTEKEKQDYKKLIKTVRKEFL